MFQKLIEPFECINVSNIFELNKLLLVVHNMFLSDYKLRGYAIYMTDSICHYKLFALWTANKNKLSRKHSTSTAPVGILTLRRRSQCEGSSLTQVDIWLHL